MEARFENKKKPRVMFVCISLLFLLSVASIVVQAKEWSGTVPVTYTKELSDNYVLFVQVSGAGSLVIEKDTLRNKEQNYLLAVDETKSILFKPDKNAVIQKVTLNNEDVSQQVKDNQLIVKGAETKQSLVVKFQTKGSTTVNGSSPTTGDSAKTGILIVLMLLSLGLFASLYIRKRNTASQDVMKETEEQRQNEE